MWRDGDGFCEDGLPNSLMDRFLEAKVGHAIVNQINFDSLIFIGRRMEELIGGLIEDKLLGREDKGANAFASEEVRKEYHLWIQTLPKEMR